MPFDTEQTSEKTDKTGDADPAMQRKVVSIVGPTASGKTGSVSYTHLTLPTN